MIRLILALAVGVAWAYPTVAQTEARPFDNFDFESGVRVQTPPPRPPSRRTKQTIKSTASNESAGSKLSSSTKPLVRPTSMKVDSSSLDSFTTGDSGVDGLIIDSARRNSVDPLLLYAIMHQESTFKPRAVSPKGARGLMQLMPETAVRYGVTNIFDPRQNIEGGARYMRFLLDQFGGDVQLALAGYNAGEGAVIKYGNRIPPYAETREYVRRITRRYALMRDPLTASYASRLTGDQLAAAQARGSAPLTVYERSVFAVRLPDGTLQLVSQ